MKSNSLPHPLPKGVYTDRNGKVWKVCDKHALIYEPELVGCPECAKKYIQMLLNNKAAMASMTPVPNRKVIVLKKTKPKRLVRIKGIINRVR